MEPLDPVGDRAPVGQQAAEPTVVHVRHPGALRVLLDGVLRLFLRADEEDGPAALGEVAGEIVCLLQVLERLLEVDDVDPSALAEDEALHLRVPAAGLVTEVDSGLQQLLHGDDRRHRVLLPTVAAPAPAPRRSGATVGGRRRVSIRVITPPAGADGSRKG